MMKLYEFGTPHNEGFGYPDAIFSVGPCFESTMHRNGFYISIRSPFIKLVKDYVDPQDFVMKEKRCRRSHVWMFRRPRADKPTKLTGMLINVWVPV